MSTSRRRFLAGMAGCAALACSGELPAAEPSLDAALRRKGLIDVNVSLSAWPFRSIPGAESPRALVAKLRKLGAAQAWAGSFDALFHKDLASVNARLAAACREQGKGMLTPFGCIHPMMPDWREELDRCVRRWRMRGLRLHPDYHGYRLDAPPFLELLEAASSLGLVVQLALLMEDERMVHPRIHVEPIDVAPLAEVVRAVPGLKLVLLNSFRVLKARRLLEVVAAGNVSVEISSLEGVGGVETLLQEVPLQRVLFGSHAPLFYAESAHLKLQESGIAGERLADIGWRNARRLWAG